MVILEVVARLMIVGLASSPCQMEIKLRISQVEIRLRVLRWRAMRMIVCCEGERHCANEPVSEWGTHSEIVRAHSAKFKWRASKERY